MYLLGLIAGLELSLDCTYMAAGVESCHRNPRILINGAGEHRIEVEWLH